MHVAELIQEAHQTAKDKGWWEGDERNYGELIALMHSELSEALECLRMHGAQEVWNEGPKPEGFLVELADVYIRIADLVGQMDQTGVFIQCLKTKLAYNKTRPHKHGKKF